MKHGIVCHLQTLRNMRKPLIVFHPLLSCYNLLGQSEVSLDNDWIVTGLRSRPARPTLTNNKRHIACILTDRSLGLELFLKHELDCIDYMYETRGPPSEHNKL